MECAEPSSKPGANCIVSDRAITQVMSFVKRQAKTFYFHMSTQEGECLVCERQSDILNEKNYLNF